MTTREGFPELWGMKEIADYGVQLAEEHGDAPRPDGKLVSMGRAQGWTRNPAFPQPVAVLAMGSVYLAEEAGPVIEEIMARARSATSRNRGGVSPETRAAILAAKDGPDTGPVVAARFGVNPATVWRIWTGSRRYVKKGD